MHDIIPDIHGQADKLTAALRRLGYNERNGAWRHSDPMLHDPAATWIWTQTEVADGAVDQATPEEVTGFFLRHSGAAAA